MVGDASQHFGEPGLRINRVQLGGHDEGRDNSCQLGASLRAGKEACLAIEGEAAERALGRVIGQAYPAVFEETPTTSRRPSVSIKA